MEDEELQAIRAARLQEMQQRAGQGAQGGEGAQNGGEKAQAEARTAALVAQILEPAAKERLSRVRLVKPERSQAVETHLLRLYQGGAIRRKVTEAQVVEMLTQVASEERRQHNTTIVFDRRDKSGNTADEDDDDDFFD